MCHSMEEQNSSPLTYCFLDTNVFLHFQMFNRPNGVILTKGYDVPYNYSLLTIRFFPLLKNASWTGGRSFASSCS